MIGIQVNDLSVSQRISMTATGERREGPFPSLSLADCAICLQSRISAY